MPAVGRGVGCALGDRGGRVGAGVGSTVGREVNEGLLVGRCDGVVVGAAVGPTDGGGDGGGTEGRGEGTGVVGWRVGAAPTLQAPSPSRTCENVISAVEPHPASTAKYVGTAATRSVAVSVTCCANAGTTRRRKPRAPLPE
jgi:hypothetical protein